MPEIKLATPEMAAEYVVALVTEEHRLGLRRMFGEQVPRQVADELCALRRADHHVGHIAVAEVGQGGHDGVVILAVDRDGTAQAVENRADGSRRPVRTRFGRGIS